MRAPYGRLCTQFYDLDKPDAPPEALEFYRTFARGSVGPLLEPMCGSGRFLLPLAVEGFEIEGSDVSAEMLAVCGARARALGVSPVVRRQAIEELAVTRQFGLVFIPSGSFCLLTDDRIVEQALRSVHAALLPGGTFVVEIECVPSEAPHGGTWGGRWVERADGAKIIISWLSEYSGVQRISRSVHKYELVHDGRLLATEFEDFDVQFYEPVEFESQLERAGFTNIERWKTYEHAPPDDGEDAVVFSCRRGC